MNLNINIDNNELIDSVDSSVWHVVQEEKKTIFYTYVVDQPAEKKIEIAQTYPNGGKDYKEVVVTPEKGHFSITYEDDSIFPYSIEIPDGISKDSPVPDIVDLIYWKKLTEEEISQREQESAEAAEKAETREEFLNTAPARVESIESTQDDIVLLLADMVGGAV